MWAGGLYSSKVGFSVTLVSYNYNNNESRTACNMYIRINVEVGYILSIAYMVCYCEAKATEY